MRQDAQRFPLTWPHGWPRTPHRARQTAAFRTTIADSGPGGVTAASRTRAVTMAEAVDRLQGQLDRLGGQGALLSTNVMTKLDGRPYATDREPEDVGAAVYFTLKDSPMALACDKWKRVADNICALAMHIDALRRIDRYGVGRLEQAFGGYKAIPAHVAQWWDVLGVPSTASAREVDDAYYLRAKAWHPDSGGSHEAMAKLNAARDEARKALA